MAKVTVTTTVEVPTKWSHLVGTLMKHTPKAVKRGCPADRVFAVVEDFKGGKGLEFERDGVIAWKCNLLPDGKISHPAFKTPLDRTDPRLFVSGVQQNGSEPTALFVPDSFYTAF
jgi:hypothetical protein